MYRKAVKSCLVTLDKRNLPVARSGAVGVVFIINLAFFASPFIDPIEVFDFRPWMLQHCFGPLTRPSIQLWDAKEIPWNKVIPFLQVWGKKSWKAVCFPCESPNGPVDWENDVPFPTFLAMNIKFSQRRISFLPTEIAEKLCQGETWC